MQLVHSYYNVLCTDNRQCLHNNNWEFMQSICEFKAHIIDLNSNKICIGRQKIWEKTNHDLISTCHTHSCTESLARQFVITDIPSMMEFLKDPVKQQEYRYYSCTLMKHSASNLIHLLALLLPHQYLFASSCEKTISEAVKQQNVY